MLILFRIESEGRARKERMNGRGTFQYVSFNFVRDLTRQQLPLPEFGLCRIVQYVPLDSFKNSQTIHIRSNTNTLFLEISFDFEEKKEKNSTSNDSSTKNSLVDVITYEEAQSIDSHCKAE